MTAHAFEPTMVVHLSMVAGLTASQMARALVDLLSSEHDVVAQEAQGTVHRLAADGRGDGGLRVVHDPLEGLTQAERRVSRAVADGLSNSAIAERLFISRHTVESHLKRAFAKLGISSRLELAHLVLRS